MATSDVIANIAASVSEAYAAAEAEGARIPSVTSVANLASAISSIPSRKREGWIRPNEWPRVDKINLPGMSAIFVYDTSKPNPWVSVYMTTSTGGSWNLIEVSVNEDGSYEIVEEHPMANNYAYTAWLESGTGFRVFVACAPSGGRSTNLVIRPSPAINGDSTCYYREFENESLVEITSWHTGMAYISGMASGAYPFPRCPRSFVLKSSPPSASINPYSPFSGTENVDLSAWGNDHTTYANMFANSTGTRYVDIRNFSFAKTTTIYRMFYTCYGLEMVRFPEKIKLDACTNCVEVFNACRGLKSLKLDIEAPVATSCQGIFRDLVMLKDIDLKMSVSESMTDMSLMFYSCKMLAELDLTGVTGAKPTNISNMFCGCISLRKLDLSSFDFSNVTNVTNLFQSGGASSIIEIRMPPFGKGLKISHTIGASTQISQDSLTSIVESLADLTGETAQTLTVGSTIKNRMTDAQKQLAADKNWTIA